MKKYDKKNEGPKKSCSVWLVMIILLIIFLLVLGGIFYLKYKSNFHFKNSFSQKTSLDNDVKKQLDDQRGEKTVQIRILEEDLSKVINSDSANFPIKNPAVKITTGKVVLTGKTGEGIIAFKVEVGIVPKAANGRVNYEIKEIKTAGVSAPKVVTDSVNEKLSNYLKQFSVTKDINVTDVKLFDGYLVITGERA